MDILFYDGDCNFCRAGATRLERMARSKELELRSFRTPGALDAFPRLTMDRCERAMQLVRPDGRVQEGAEVVVQALRGRWYGWLLKVYYLPGLRWLADAVYRRIAKNRFKIAGRNCESGACAVHYQRLTE